MKKTVITLTSILITFVATARVIIMFHGWDNLENNSPYISVVRCGNQIPPKPNLWVEGATKSDFQVQVIAILKGANDINPVRLLTDHELYPGKNYLVFGYCNHDVYCAYEDYRVVQLDRFFSASLIAGKPLDEQIEILLKIGLDKLTKQIEQEQSEKQRLEEGIRKQ